MALIADIFADVIAKHDLTLLGVQMRSAPVTPGYLWHATGHWDGFSRDGITCASGDGPTAEAAIEACINQCRHDRTPFELVADSIELAA